jgi:hypothetical protein
MSHARVLYLRNIVIKKLYKPVKCLRIAIAHHRLYEQLSPFVDDCGAELFHREDDLVYSMQDPLHVGTSDWIRVFNQDVAIQSLAENFAALTLDPGQMPEA